MRESEFSFADAALTYLVCKEPVEAFSCHLPFAGYCVNHTAATPVYRADANENALLLLGVCVDTHGEIAREDIAAYLLAQAGGIDGLTAAAERLAGSFVVLFADGSTLYAFTDAIGCLSVCYTQHRGALCLASHDQVLANYTGCRPSDTMARIRRAPAAVLPDANVSHLPWDRTLYEDIRLLLPNHYLSDKAGAVRYWPKADDLPQASGDAAHIDAVLDRSVQLIDNTVLAYARDFTLVGALTGGYDSRVICAFLMRNAPGCQFYTVRGSRLTEESGDIVVPRQIAAQFGLDYALLAPQPVSDAYYEQAAAHMGPYASRGALDLSNTINAHFPGQVTMNGNIIEQIGRKMIGRDAPWWTLSPESMMLSAYNYADETRALYARQIAQVKKEGLLPLGYDLMSWENYCGRWVVQAASTYAMNNTLALNIFNCRELLTGWISITRKMRNRRAINLGLLSRTCPELLELPFNPDVRKAMDSKWINSWPHDIAAAWGNTLRYRSRANRVARGSMSPRG